MRGAEQIFHINAKQPSSYVTRCCHRVYPSSRTNDASTPNLPRNYFTEKQGANMQIKRTNRTRRWMCSFPAKRATRFAHACPRQIRPPTHIKNAVICNNIYHACASSRLFNGRLIYRIAISVLCTLTEGFAGRSRRLQSYRN